MNLIAAHRACGIIYRFLRTKHKGKKYLLPANVCHVVPMTFLTAEVPFDFVDINSETLCIDEDECLKRLNSGEYEGILFVRTYGYLYKTDTFFARIKQVDPTITIIDDRCLSIPSFEYEKNYSDIQLYSTGYSKYVELKYGAYALFEDPKSVSRIKKVEDLVFDDKFDIDLFVEKKKHNNQIIVTPPKFWLDTTLFSPTRTNEYIAEIKNKLKETHITKQYINNIYQKYLNKYSLGEGYNDWRYQILIQDPKKMMQSIFSNGLFASNHYDPATNLFAPTQTSKNADNLHAHVINLFNDHYFTQEKAEALSLLILKAIQND